MQYYLIINIILVLFFIVFNSFIYKWLRQDFNLKEILFCLLFSSGIVLLFKFPFQSHFFGLEYEDSYVFNFSARQLYERVYPISFLTDGITVGSLVHPISTNTYGGHFITYPVFISWFFYVFGYNILFPSYINTFIEFLTVLTLSVAFKKVLGYKTHWYIPGVIYSLAPAMNVFGTTQLSETFSSFVVLMSILSLLSYFKSYNKTVLLAFSICFLTAIVTKRENIILLFMILSFSVFKLTSLKKNQIPKLLPIIASVVILLIYLFFIQNVALIEKTESSEISTPTFSIINLLNLIPVFIKALATFKWFNVYLILLIISTFFTVFHWKRNLFQLSLLILFMSYFIIYTLHYRSYYYVHFGDIKPFEALRYLNNIYVISTLIISVCIIAIFKNPIFKRAGILIFFVLVVVSFLSTNKLRKEFHEIEKEERFSNPILTLGYLNEQNKSVLIADNILIFQLLGDKYLDLVDLYSLDNSFDYFKNKTVYLFLSNFSKTDNFQYRYPDISKKLQLMKKVEIIKFGNNDSLYKIE